MIFLYFIFNFLIYVSRIASNEIFKPTFNLKKIWLFLIIFLITIQFIYYNNIYWINLSTNSDIDNFKELIFFFNNENKINLRKLYNNQTFLIITILVIYLFITLIAVVKITNIYYGPLRSSLN